jgi:hypothetical protein
MLFTAKSVKSSIGLAVGDMVEAKEVSASLLQNKVLALRDS